MACAHVQQTLPPADRDLSLYAQSLGWLRLITWIALEQTTVVQAPFSTGAALTQRMLHALVDVGLIEIGAAGPGAQRALYEPLVWRYGFKVGPHRTLQAILQEALTAVSSNPAATEAQRELWEALAEAEVETYLVHLLKRHALDPARASEIAASMQDVWEPLSLARRRYLVWYGVRGATAALLRNDFDQDAAVHAMLEEMRRRCRWLVGKQTTGELPPTDYRFMPEPHWKRPILLELLISTTLPDATSYWTAQPSGLGPA